MSERNKKKRTWSTFNLLYN